MKKKLLVVVGAGAAIEFGMPSVAQVNDLFNVYAQKWFSLASDGSSNLYRYISDEVCNYYAKCPKPYLQKSVNFEEVLYQLGLLAAHLSDNLFQYAPNALLNPVPLPNIRYFGTDQKQVDGYVLLDLTKHLIDSLVEEFINRCSQLKNTKNTELNDLALFLGQLSDQFDLGVVTLNYDDVFTQAFPSLRTGFNQNTGEFEPAEVLFNDNWNFIYHLHGSIHYSMQGSKVNMHAIKWDDNPTVNHNVQSAGRNTQESSEGINYAISPIIAGFGKTQQILRQPFQTFFSQLDRLACEADSLLFLGYGFNDFHLNAAFSTIRDRRRPVVVVTRGAPGQDPLARRHDMWANNLRRTIPTNNFDMIHKAGSFPADVGELILKKELEFSNQADCPLAIWYGGFLDGCRNIEKIALYLQ